MKYSLLFILGIYLLPTQALNAQSIVITTNAIPPSTFCSCDTLTVGFTSTGTFNAGNTIEFQLSDPMGTFTNPTPLGSLVAWPVNNGTLNVTLPCSTIPGMFYRIRTISYSPGIIGSDNGSNLQVIASFTPNLSISSSSTTACEGDPISFIASSSNAGANPTYQWKVNGMNVGTNASTYTSTTLNNGDIVSCEIVSNAPCAQNPGVSNSLTITIQSNTVPSASLTASVIPAPINTNTAYTTVIPAIITNYVIDWYNNTTFLATTNSPNATYSFTPTNITDSIWAVLKPTGCFSPDSILTSKIGTAFPDNLFDFKKLNVSIYPNPSNYYLTISNLNNGDRILVKDILGQTLIEKKILDSGNTKIETATFAPSVYTIHLYRKGTLYTQQFIRE